jgi:hypothetical protein
MLQDIPRSERRRPRFPGIVEDARRLGVSRVHLYLVLIGDRQSPTLLARYQRLKARKGRVG